MNSENDAEMCLERDGVCGTWMAHWVECLILDFGSGHDLTVHEIKAPVRYCADSTESAWDSLSLPLPPPHPAHVLVLSLKINK